MGVKDNPAIFWTLPKTHKRRIGDIEDIRNSHVLGQCFGKNQFDEGRMPRITRISLCLTFNMSAQQCKGSPGVLLVQSDPAKKVLPSSVDDGAAYRFDSPFAENQAQMLG